MGYMYYFIDEIMTTNQNSAYHTAYGYGNSVVQTRYQDASHGNLCCTLSKTNIYFSLSRYSTSKPCPWALVEDMAVKCVEQEKMLNKIVAEKLARKCHDTGKHRTVQTVMLSPGRSQLRTKFGVIRRMRLNTFLCFSRARNLIKPTHETLSLFFPLSDFILPPRLIALSSYEDEANMTGGEAESKRVKVILVRLVETAGYGKRSKSQSLEVLKEVMTSTATTRLTNFKNAKTAVMLLSYFQPNGKGNESPS